MAARPLSRPSRAASRSPSRRTRVGAAGGDSSDPVSMRVDKLKLLSQGSKAPLLSRAQCDLLRVELVQRETSLHLQKHGKEAGKKWRAAGGS